MIRHFLRPTLAVFLGLLAVVHASSVRPAGVQTSIAAQPLTTDAPAERTLAAGETHTYRLTLAAGQYLSLLVYPEGILVAATMSGPNGRHVADEKSLDSSSDPIPISLITEKAGDYQLEVRAAEAGARRGRYRIAIETLRPALLQDASRVEAARALREGDRLRVEGTATSLRAALEPYERAVALFRSSWGQDGLRASPASVGQAILVDVPAKVLPPGDYELALTGAMATGEVEAIGDYYFTIVRR